MLIHQIRKENTIMPKWSEAQYQAIQQTGKNLVVSASAGSGKTAVLTARMLKRVVDDRIPVENLLAMTFTDAAASEMKSRLYSQLDEQREKTKDPELKSYLDKQCAMMGSAMICTIHSFCLSVIKEYYYALGISLERINTIFSEDQMVQIRNEVLNKTMKQLKNEDSSSFLEAVNHFSSRADDYTEFEETLIKIVDTALNQPDPDFFFNLVLDKAQQPASFETMDSDIQFYLFLKIQLEIEQILIALRQLEIVCFDESLDQAVVDSVFLKQAKLMPALDAIQQRNYRDLIRIIRNFAVSPLKNAKSEPYKKLRKTINESCQSLVENWFDEDTIYYDQKHLYNITKTLIHGAQLYLSYLNQRKEEKQGLDFSDMEHLAYQILSNKESGAADRLKQRYAEILVDEFQDTNEFQNSMIEMISRGNNVFRVGDIKQSIYRFRNAKPAIMADLQKKHDENNDTITLHHNYRSNRSVIEFNNLLFQKLMNVQGMKNEYTNDDFALVGTEGQDDHYQYPVTFIKIQKEKNEIKDEKLSTKALVLANKILDMKNTTEFNHWKDYCVLVRSHAIKDEIRYVFEKLNIPYTTTLMSGFYKSSSIRILTSWLSLLEDCSQDIACVSILTGFYDYTDEMLANLQLKRNKMSYFDIAITTDTQFKEDYFSLKRILSQEGYSTVLQKIIQTRDYYWTHLDKKERANVDLFLSKALAASQRSTQLKVFLKEIEDSLDLPSSTAVSASKSDDVVQITTIHQSKGLQYPVVFFWSNSRTVINDELSPCMVDEKLGLGLYHLDHPYRFKRPTLQRHAIIMKNALEELEENIRLYYVALTRAQKASYILDYVDDSTLISSVNLPLFFQKKGSTSLILSATESIDHPCFKTEIISEYYQSQYKAEKVSQIKKEITTYEAPAVQQELMIETPSSFERAQLQPLTFKASSGQKRGSRLHKAIEQLPEAPWTLQQIMQCTPRPTAYESQMLLKLGNHPQFIKLNQKTFHKEFSFATLKDSRIIHGFVDFVAIDDSSLFIVDFKSDTYVTEEDLILRYKDQINIYAESLQMIYPNKQINQYIYSFALEKFIEL